MWGWTLLRQTINASTAAMRFYSMIFPSEQFTVLLRHFLFLLLNNASQHKTKITNLTSSGEINPIWADLYVTLGISESFSAQGCSVNVKLTISEEVWCTLCLICERKAVKWMPIADIWLQCWLTVLEQWVIDLAELILLIIFSHKSPQSPPPAVQEWRTCLHWEFLSIKVMNSTGRKGQLWWSLNTPYCQ